MLRNLRNALARKIGVDIGGLWQVKVTLDKYFEDITPFKGRENEFYSLYKPYETKEFTQNGLLNEGINAMWTLICGGTETVYNATNARIGVGDSTAAFDATHTDLQGTNKLYKGMDSGYPTFGTAQKAVFKASFGTTEANWAWNEWSVDNGATALKNLNRKVASLGSKSGGTWALTVELILS